MSSSDFYIELYSNASLDVFPDNTLSSFRVQLPHNINLARDYEVAVTDCAMPCAFQPPSNLGVVRVIAKADPIHAPRGASNSVADWRPSSAGYYDPSRPDLHPEPNTTTMTPTSGIPDGVSIPNIDTGGNPRFQVWTHNIPEETTFWTGEDLLNYLANLFSMKNESSPFHGLVKRTHDENNADILRAFVSITKRFHGFTFVLRDPDVYVEFSGPLVRLLGFDSPEGSIIRFGRPGLYNFPQNSVDVQGYEPRLLQVYCSIIEPWVVSNVKAPLLRTIAVTERGIEKRILSREFVSRSYLPVNVQSFQTIQMEIRDTTGKYAPFQDGLTYFRLHFRPRDTRRL